MVKHMGAELQLGLGLWADVWDMEPRSLYSQRRLVTAAALNSPGSIAVLRFSGNWDGLVIWLKHPFYSVFQKAGGDNWLERHLVAVIHCMDL